MTQIKYMYYYCICMYTLVQAHEHFKIKKALKVTHFTTNIHAHVHVCNPEFFNLSSAALKGGTLPQNGGQMYTRIPVLQFVCFVFF